MQFEDRVDIRSSVIVHFMSELCKILRPRPLTSEHDDGVVNYSSRGYPVKKNELFTIFLFVHIIRCQASMHRRSQDFRCGCAFIGVDSRVAKRSDVQTECNGDVAIGGSHNTVHRTRPMGQGVLTVLKKDLLKSKLQTYCPEYCRFKFS